MLSKLKAFIGRLTYPEDAFYDGYEHRLLVGVGRFRQLSSDSGFQWASLKQNWLGSWVIDDDCQTWSSEDLRKYAEEQSK